MTEETTTIEVVRYRTPDGKPTCALDFPAGKVCKFLRLYYFGCKDHFGCKETCVFAPVARKEQEALQRRDGYLIPDTWCRVWQGDA